MTLRFDIPAAEIRARVDAYVGRLVDVAEEAAAAVLDELKGEAERLAESRITRPSSGGYVDSFVVETERDGAVVTATLRNAAPHARWVEEGREPGEPRLKTYVDNAQNRRLGRVGGSYVSSYVGQPPSSVFGQNGWAPAFAVGRDGTPGRFVIRDVRRRYPRRVLVSMAVRELFRLART